MAIEIQDKQCKVCLELKKRVSCGTFSNKNHKRWVDENGKLWNGRVCPDCHRGRSLVNMHRLRGKNDSSNS